MEILFPIVITVVLVVFIGGYLLGRLEERRMWVSDWERTFGYRPTSPPRWKSGTPEPERGSDDTG